MFRELIERAEHTPERAERMALLKRACEMYDGEFLQTLSGEEWVLLESVQYKNLYGEALSEVCAWLIECEEYEEAIRLCTPACEMYPLDEWQGVRMECYIAMGQYEEAYREYEETARVLFEELGLSPSKKMLDHLRTIGEHANGTPRSVQEIRDDLTKSGEEEGAIYCSLPSFRDVYCMMRRIMEREGQSIYLMLCSITDGKGYVQKNKERLGKMSERLYDAIKYSLRRCDSFTRYNSAQFLVLLVGTSLENCGQISERITRYFTKGHKTWGNYLDCQVASIADMEFGGAGFSFLKQI